VRLRVQFIGKLTKKQVIHCEKRLKYYDNAHHRLKPISRNLWITNAELNIMANDNVDEQDKKIEDIENKLLAEDDYSETPPSDIVAFNELRSCADLVRMYKNDQLIIKPDFQRDIVWPNPAQTRFIDSLVKQLPIPSMCLSLDYNTQERLMIDGLQRISSIIKFLTDSDWRLSSLDDIDEKISGKTSGFIKKKYPQIYSRIENLTIPVTVLRCDYSKKSHLNYLFTIFHRLNTGGNKLSNQEIRNCIYQGSFNDMLKEIVNYPNMRGLFGLKPNETKRYAYEELVLRVFAFADEYMSYNGKLAKFLNDYMERNRNIDEDEVDSRTRAFKRAIDLFYERMMEGNQLPKLSKATTEALLVGMYLNIDELEQLDTDQLREKYQSLREDQNFSFENLNEGIASTEKVKARIGRAIELFS
jgi:hypothetical protein